MNYNLAGLFLFVFLIGTSCNDKNKKNDLIVYPEYCGGCVIKNFGEIKNKNLEDRFNLYFDSTDIFILNTAKMNNLEFTHVDKSQIPLKFGDYANLVVIKSNSQAIELRTNEIITEGVHY
jgi:hypothetical protein